MATVGFGRKTAQPESRCGPNESKVGVSCNEERGLASTSRRWTDLLAVQHRAIWRRRTVRSSVVVARQGSEPRPTKVGRLD